MAKRDYYETLGVGRNAADDEIKKAYRKLAHQHHPDKNAGDKAAEEKFKEISEAYEILKDPEKRRAYDTYGHAAAGGGGFDFAQGGFGDIFGDIFEDFFGTSGGRGGRRAARGADLRYNLEISFEESVFGKETKIKIPRWESCHMCGGTGAKSSAAIKVCPTCQGKGQIRFQQGFFTVSRTCTDCRGEGRVVSELCPKCHGDKKIQKERSLQIKIPPGVETGSRLRLSGEGEPGPRGGPSGDLYVFISVKEHPLFTREGDHIVMEYGITFTQAALGAKIGIPTLKEPVAINIPPGTQNGKMFRFKGYGVPNVRGYGVGDQIVRIRVDIPVRLTPRQRELLEEYARISGEDVSDESKGFMDKVKNLFE